MPTLRSDAFVRSPRSATLEGDDVVPMEIDAPLRPIGGTQQQELKTKFFIAVDYGTTYSAVSFTKVEPGENEERIGPDKVHSISNYPGDPRTNGYVAKEVPTELAYVEVAGPRRGLPCDRDWSELMQDVEAQEDTSTESDDSEEEVGVPPWRHENNEPEFRAPPQNLHWGYMVQDMLGRPNDLTPVQLDERCVRKAKLLLDETDRTKAIRTELSEKIQYLRIIKKIRKDEDVIIHFLTSLFRHVKGELEAGYGYTKDCDVEFILCVPPIWSNKASRRMHDAMATALRGSGFTSKATKAVKSLFIVSEPEAAAAWILTMSGHDNQFRANDTFILLDAGGGTVDAIIYSVKGRARDVRLRREEVDGDGVLCGSSFINEEFGKHVRKRLDHAVYLDSGSESIDQIIQGDGIMGKFEFQFKRQMDFRNWHLADQFFNIRGLLANAEHNVRAGGFQVSPDENWEFFQPSLNGVSSLLKSQLKKAKEKSLRIDKIVLIGGFAQSPALREHLKKRMTKLNKRFKSQTEFVAPMQRDASIAVASGAVLRALNKRSGPGRIIKSSYGILCREKYDDQFPGHEEAAQTAEYDDHDGHHYIKDSLVWLIKKGEEISGDPEKSRVRLPMHKIISLKVTDSWVCKQTLYVSDECTESHYQKHHAMNKNKHEIVGTIVANMSFLKRDKLIQPTVPKPGAGRPHYLVEFEIQFEVIDRNLYYRACWPIGENGREVKGSAGWTNIAAAFDPGTQ